jgi:hypothetical protein
MPVPGEEAGPDDGVDPAVHGAQPPDLQAMVDRPASKTKL